MRRALLICALLLPALAPLASGLNVAVLRLGDNGWRLPGDPLAGVNEHIQDVIAGSTRLGVVGIGHALDESDVAGLQRRLGEMRSPKGAVAPSVRPSAVPLSDEDLGLLAASRAVIVPVLTDYSLDFSEASAYTAQLETTFSVIEEGSPLVALKIRTLGRGATDVEAIGAAARQIPRQLAFRLRELPDFQVKTGIVVVDATTVLLQFGRNMGVHVGDLYALSAARPGSAPEGGLVEVDEVRKDYSYAHIIYSDGAPRIGDQVQPIPRLGLETTFYVHATFNNTQLAGGSSEPVIVTAGTLLTWTRGLYDFRPVIGFEYPFNYAPGGGAPVDVFLGGELNWRFWRFDIVPLAALGLNELLPVSAGQSPAASTYGGFWQLSVGYLVTRAARVQLDFGYTQWFPIGGGLGYGGLEGGLGLTLDW